VWDDTDKDDWEATILPFQMGLRVRNYTVHTFPVVGFLRDDLDYSRFVDDGRTVLQYQEGVNEKTMQSNAFEAALPYDPNRPPLVVIAANTNFRNSAAFKSVWNPGVYDAMCAFEYRPGGWWSYSLYTDRDDVDVSEIAKALGGGGHRKAAGFESPEMLLRPL